MRSGPHPNARELKTLHAEYDDAMTRGDLSAALSARAHALLISGMRLFADSYDALSEVFITDDALAQPAVEVFGILLHEAAHAVAVHRTIKDTSRQGRYHNARFKAVAEEIGLEGHDRDPVFGWSLVNVTAATAARCRTARRDRGGAHSEAFVRTLNDRRQPRRGACGGARVRARAQGQERVRRVEAAAHHMWHMRNAALSRRHTVRLAETTTSTMKEPVPQGAAMTRPLLDCTVRVAPAS